MMNVSAKINTFIIENPVYVVIVLISMLFLGGTIEYDLLSLYSDQFLIMTMQIFISSFIINIIIAIGIDLTENKRNLVTANCHILLILYFNLVFQIAQKIKFGFPKTEYFVSLLLAMAFVVVLVFITNENYFNEKIWSVSVYFSLVYLFDIEHNKYFTALFAIIFLVNLAYKFQIYTNGLLNQFYFKYLESDITLKRVFNYYGAISIIYWCCIYHIINSKLGKNNLAIVLNLGFTVPNIMMILQQIFTALPILYFTISGYFIFNIILQKAQIHAKNVASDPEMLFKLDETFKSLEKKDFVFFGLLKNNVGKMWTSFMKITKETFNAGGGPKNWGPQVAGVAGVAGSTYFGVRYIKQNDEANEIAKEANEIAKQQSEIAKDAVKAQNAANEIAKEQTAELKKNNQLLEQSNLHAKTGADAAVEYNKIARQQENIETDLD